MLQRGEETWLNSQEAAQLLGVLSHVTFQRIRDKYALKGRKFDGAGNATWYKKSDVEKIKEMLVKID